MERGSQGEKRAGQSLHLSSITSTVSSTTSLSINSTSVTTCPATPVTLLPSALTAQPVGSIRSPCPSPVAGGTLSQQAMILKNGTPRSTQTQMYLRTQMLILAPAASAPAVQSDRKPANSTYTQSRPTQVQALALHTHLSGAMAQSVHLKPLATGQTVVSSLPKMSISSLGSTTMEASGSGLGQLSTAHQLITGSSLCPALLKPQLHCPLSQHGTPQIIIHQRASTHKQGQPITLHVTPQERRPTPLCLQAGAPPAPLLPLTLSGASSTSGPPPESVLVPAVSSPAQAPRPQQQPGSKGISLPILNSSAHGTGSNCASSKTSSTNMMSTEVLAFPGPLALALPPTSLPEPPLPSAQELTVPACQVSCAAHDTLPVAEGLGQLPLQKHHPPQTVAVDLRMQSVAQTAHQSRGLVPDQMEMERVGDPSSTLKNQTPSSNSNSSMLQPSAYGKRVCDEDIQPKPENCPAGLDTPVKLSSQSVIQSPVESILDTCSCPPSQPAEVTQSPFVEEGHATPPESQEPVTVNGDPDPEDTLMDVNNPSENSSDSDMDDEATDEGVCLSDVLQCEFCGKRSYSPNFQCSRRFCSSACARRFNVSWTRRQALLRSGWMSRWPQRPMGRRGRPPGRADGTSREYFMRQLTGRLDGREEEEEDEDDTFDDDDNVDDDELQLPMMTRLQYQATQETVPKQAQEEQKQVHAQTGGLGLDVVPVAKPSASQWTVDQVCTYINTIPGCAELAGEFRAQEIDGQALLLLSEDHLVTSMNVKLGPALKICAQIHKLKEPKEALQMDWQ